MDFSIFSNGDAFSVAPSINNDNFKNLLSHCIVHKLFKFFVSLIKQYPGQMSVCQMSVGQMPSWKQKINIVILMIKQIGQFLLSSKSECLFYGPGFGIWIKDIWQTDIWLRCCLPYFIEYSAHYKQNYDEILHAHYTWKVVEIGLKTKWIFSVEKD